MTETASRRPAPAIVSPAAAPPRPAGKSAQRPLARPPTVRRPQCAASSRPGAWQRAAAGSGGRRAAQELTQLGRHRPRHRCPAAAAARAVDQPARAFQHQPPPRRRGPDGLMAWIRPQRRHWQGLELRSATSKLFTESLCLAPSPHPAACTRERPLTCSDRTYRDELIFGGQRVTSHELSAMNRPLRTRMGGGVGGGS